MSLFKNTKGTRIAVGVFLVCILTFFAYEAKGETTAEGGITVLNLEHSDGYNIFITERFNDKWSAGLGLVGEQVDKYEREIDNNLHIFGQRVVSGPGILSRVELGIGLNYALNKTTVNGSNLNYHLSLQLDVTDKVYFIYRHISNAGSRSPNTGQDLLNFGWRFK